MTRSTWFDDGVRGVYILRIISQSAPYETPVPRIAMLYGAAWCVSVITAILLPCGAVRCSFYGAAVRCGYFFLGLYGAILCGFVRGKAVRCGAVRLKRTKPHRTVGQYHIVRSLGGFRGILVVV